MTRRTLGVAAVFLVGCAVGGVSSQLAVPKANAQQTATLTKWEYSCFHETNWIEGPKKANRLGAQNWELTTTDAELWCFKRPKL